MPTTYLEQFFAIDPSSPPPAGTSLTVQQLALVDWQNNNIINTNSNNGDRIDGSDIRQMYPGDRITVTMQGNTVTITGVTFYLADGRVLFTPTDGTRLHDATFQSSTFVNTQGGLSTSVFAPPCFTLGTRIRVPGGEVPIEDLAADDLVETMDHGPQPIRWIGERGVIGRGAFAPVEIDAGVLGNSRKLCVSPQHRMLVTGWRAELLFGEPEILVAAKYLVGLKGVRFAPVGKISYVHLLFDQHEIIFAEGAASESYYPASALLEQDDDIRAEIEALFPELLSNISTCRAARPIAKAHEGRTLIGRAWRSP